MVQYYWVKQIAVVQMLMKYMNNTQEAPLLIHDKVNNDMKNKSISWWVGNIYSSFLQPSSAYKAFKVWAESMFSWTV